MSRAKIGRNHALRRIAVIAILLIIITDIVLVLLTGIYYRRFTASSCTADAQRFQAALDELLENLDLSEFRHKDTLDSSDPDDQLYDGVREYIKGLCEIAGARYTYLFNIVNDSDMRFIMTVASDREEDVQVAAERGLGVTVNIPENDRNNISRAWNGEFVGPHMVNNHYGEVMIFYFPVYYEDEITFIAGIDFDVSTIVDEAVKYVVTTVVIVTGVLIAVLGLLLLVLRKKIFTPIKRISVQMNSFDPEKEHAKLKLNSYHEIEEIHASFNKLSDDILGYIQNLKKMTEERAQTTAELNIARSIQNGMVPSSKKLSGKGYEIFASATPAKEVGGDFYDLFELHGQVFFVIADVSGKGIAAALFMAMAMNQIRGRLRLGMSPAEALNLVNDELSQTNPEGMFVTVFAAALDPHTGEVVYANAGHTRPVISGGSDKRFIYPDHGIALGLFEDAGIINESLFLGSGECITVYTDGVTEAVSRDQKLFGELNLIKAADGGSAEETALSVIGAVRSFSEGCEQSDDITLLTLKYTAENEIYMDEMPCGMSSLGKMRGKLLELAGSSEKKRRIALACEEIFVNIIEYSGSEKIGVVISASGDELTVRFEDSGKEFDPLKDIPPQKSFEDYDTGGMGIRMVIEIAESVKYYRLSGKNVILMVFKL